VFQDPTFSKTSFSQPENISRTGSILPCLHQMPQNPALNTEFSWKDTGITPFLSRGPQAGIRSKICSSPSGFFGKGWRSKTGLRGGFKRQFAIIDVFSKHGFRNLNRPFGLFFDGKETG
jgi:hypothetical protein